MGHKVLCLVFFDVFGTSYIVSTIVRLKFFFFFFVHWKL